MLTWGELGISVGSWWLLYRVYRSLLMLFKFCILWSNGVRLMLSATCSGVYQKMPYIRYDVIILGGACHARRTISTSTPVVVTWPVQILYKRWSYLLQGHPVWVRYVIGYYTSTMTIFYRQSVFMYIHVNIILFVISMWRRVHWRLEFV